jgi:hopanoid biosynthesis associated protein HpnK
MTSRMRGRRQHQGAQDGGQRIRIIFNADDFGRSAAINEAIKRAYEKGVLTSASLMVSGKAVEEAVELARQMPDLAVGLHIVLVDGPAVLSAREIPHLVDDNGSFPSDIVRMGVRYGFSRAAQEEMARELEAQFERFVATGLPLSHVDGHHHLHMHPTVFARLVPLAERYGAQGIRVPRGELWLNLGYDRAMLMTKVLWAAALWLLSPWCRRCLRGHSLSVPRRVYGMMQSGQMHEPYVVRVLQQLDVPSAELFFHPTVGPIAEPSGPNMADLEALLSPRVRQLICKRGLLRSRYAQLGTDSEER